MKFIKYFFGWPGEGGEVEAFLEKTYGIKLRVK
jgi:hypothetical protein